jgi:hypothetical protein
MKWPRKAELAQAINKIVSFTRRPLAQKMVLCSKRYFLLPAGDDHVLDGQNPIFESRMQCVPRIRQPAAATYCECSDDALYLRLLALVAPPLPPLRLPRRLTRVWGIFSPVGSSERSPVAAQIVSPASPDRGSHTVLSILHSGKRLPPVASFFCRFFFMP